jgi:hypothetical protein
MTSIKPNPDDFVLKDGNILPLFLMLIIDLKLTLQTFLIFTQFKYVQAQKVPRT